MLQINSKTLKKHYTTIKDEVFFVDKKWPHFEILFDDIVKLSKRFRKNKNILSIERGGLYGNVSLFAPFFL